MDRVYLVWASMGEYSDRTEWAVAAYQESEMAHQHCNLANAAISELQQTLSKLDWSYEEEEAVITGFLKNFHLDKNYARGHLTGYRVPHYVVVQVPFCLHVDQYQETIGQ